jgi:NAD(P)H-dependent FMN reductase
VQFELVELASYELPLLSEPTVPGAAHRQYETPQTIRWGQKVDELDGFVWVTPEYNHGVPAAMKNALDVLYPEWNHKTVAFVSYGADGGVRAVEQWRAIVANVMMYDVRGQVALSTFADFEDGRLAAQDRREGELKTMLDQLVALTTATSSLRRQN